MSDKKYQTYWLFPREGIYSEDRPGHPEDPVDHLIEAVPVSALDDLKAEIASQKKHYEKMFDEQLSHRAQLTEALRDMVGALEYSMEMNKLPNQITHDELISACCEAYYKCSTVLVKHADLIEKLKGE